MFDIEPDIRRAHTPPNRLYTDPVVYQAARERIFAKSWQLVGDASIVRVPGQVWPTTLLEGCLDEPLLLVRDHGDAIRCMSNVCTHRGMLVCEHAGIETALRCRYHGRRFRLDGSFERMPEFEQAENFPTPADDLPKLPLEQWGPLLFTSLGAQCTFDEWVRPVRERVGWLPLGEFGFSAARSRDYLVEANWALYCENYLEGFHIPFVHAGLATVVDYDTYRTELFRCASLQVGLSDAGGDVFDLPRASPDFGQKIAGYYFFLFPNLMLNFYPWGLSINVVKPLGVSRTRVSFLAYVWREDRLGRGAGAELDRVEREDESVVETVQRGLRSRLYSRGRYSPTREQGCHHFHCLLAESLKGIAP